MQIFLFFIVLPVSEAVSSLPFANQITDGTENVMGGFV